MVFAKSQAIPNLTTILFILALCGIVSSQVGRDIALQFFELDQDYDFLVNSSQIKHLLPQQLQQQDRYYNLPIFKNIIYPKIFWREFDTDKDNKISVEELQQIINNKWTIYSNMWPKDSSNLLDILYAEQFLQICDKNQDKSLTQQEMPACLHGVLIMQSERYPWKIQSIFYKNDKVGYDYGEFKKILPNFKASQQEIQRYAQKLFGLFEWDNEKIRTDFDQLIGPEQGKVMQPILSMMFLDRDRNGKLNEKQASFYLRRFGGDDAYKILNANGDDKVDKNQFVAYYTFASCTDCSKDEKKEVQIQIKEKKAEQKNKHEDL